MYPESSIAMFSYKEYAVISNVKYLSYRETLSKLILKKIKLCKKAILKTKLNGDRFRFY